MSNRFFTLPKLSPRRTYLIARRDFLGYVKTWGFWLTALGPFIGLLFLALGFSAVLKATPISYTTIVDETGIHAQAIKDKHAEDYEDAVTKALEAAGQIAIPTKDRPQFTEILESGDLEAAQKHLFDYNKFAKNYVTIPTNNLAFLDPPSNDIEEMKKYLADNEIQTPSGETVELNGVLHIFEKDNELQAEYWTSIQNNIVVESAFNSYFSRLAVSDYLSIGQLNREDLRTAIDDAIKISKFNPLKVITPEKSQEVTFDDNLPYVVAAGLALMLWLTIFTGAYMLLVSMVEEKINKVLEMLLATTRFSEIFVGKLLGVAALTMTSLLPWVAVGLFGFYSLVNMGDATVVEGFSSAIDTKMYIFLPIFLLLGYIFYGAMFIALGAIAESMQDASTLMTPMILLMTLCIGVVPLGLNYPDSPIMTFGQWFPFSAPFAAIVRLPSDPPLWHTLGSVFSLLLSSLFVIWASSRLLQQGVLSGSGVSAIKSWFAHKVLRRSPTK